jgi:expansin (peptidoglycan-binding protein)
MRLHGETAKMTSSQDPRISTISGTQKCASVNTARAMEAFNEFSSARGSYALHGTAGSMVMLRPFAKDNSHGLKNPVDKQIGTISA